MESPKTRTADLSAASLGDILCPIISLPLSIPPQQTATRGQSTTDPARGEGVNLLLHAAGTCSPHHNAEPTARLFARFLVVVQHRRNQGIVHLIRFKSGALRRRGPVPFPSLSLSSLHCHLQAGLGRLIGLGNPNLSCPVRLSTSYFVPSYTSRAASFHSYHIHSLPHPPGNHDSADAVNPNSPPPTTFAAHALSTLPLAQSRRTPQHSDRHEQTFKNLLSTSPP